MDGINSEGPLQKLCPIVGYKKALSENVEVDYWPTENWKWAIFNLTVENILFLPLMLVELYCFVFIL